MYLIYGKNKTEKMFHAFDLNKGNFVRNLIYASMWQVKDRADEVCKMLNDSNVEYEFEVRKSK